MQSGHFVVTYESIISNLTTLRTYKPLIQEFWSQGIFDERDKRYFRLINRSNTFGDIIDWSIFDGPSSYEEFRQIYWGENVGKESYFDSMTHFDFKTLLPALLQVEDRVSMAHGLESRVPFLDHPLVELVATIPPNIKFQGGSLKHVLRAAMGPVLPPAILDRKDKMGFPVPLTEWMKGEAREFIRDVLSCRKAQERELTLLGEIIGANVATAIRSGDRASIESDLLMLARRPSIRRAIVYDAQCEPLARYTAHTGEPGAELDFQPAGHVS